MPRVNPEILRWARETAGLDLETAAEKIALNEARGYSGADRLAALEAGAVEPTRALLLRMSKQYRRPLLVFYLSTPPRKGDRGQDFRTLPEGSTEEDEAVLDGLLRDIQARHALIKAALEDEEDRQPSTWVGTASADEGADALLRRLRDALGVSLAEFRSSPTAEDAFGFLRDRVEALGAFVVLASNLGSHHSTLGVDVFRGLAIAEPVAPFIVVNDQDSRTAWSFTLLHELAHLLLGFSGISGGTFDRDIERLCNTVASEFLLPSSELAQFFPARVQATSRLQEEIGMFAQSRRISRSMVAYRLFLSGVISADQWRSVTAAFRTRWLEQRDRQREAARERAGGPSYYVVKRHRLGSSLLQTTARLLASGALTTVKAAQVLGVRPNNLTTLLSGVAGANSGGN